MCSLTKELILSKSKGKSLESVKKLNCWASGLNEISILKELSNLQVLTLRFIFNLALLLVNLLTLS